MAQGYTCTTGSSASASSSSSDSSAAGSTVGQYERLVQRGSLKEDVQQRLVLQKLAQLQHVLKNYSNNIYMKTPPQRLRAKNVSAQPQKGDESPEEVKEMLTDLSNNYYEIF